MTGNHDGYDPIDFIIARSARAVDDALHQYWAREDSFPVQGEPTRHQPEDVAEFTGKILWACRQYGADMVGVAKMEPSWLYDASQADTFGPDGLHTVVVIAVAMDYDAIIQSPTAIAATTTYAGYSLMSVAATDLTMCLRQLGYQAVPAGNEIAMSIPMAVAAGLGRAGRTGQLITKSFGPRVRLCKVFTDAPLICGTPGEPTLEPTCHNCDDCVSACPGGAIPTGEPGAEGRWMIDVEKCRQFWRDNGICCASCVSCCRLNRKPK